MGRDRNVGPGLGVLLLAALTFGAVFWTAKFTEAEDTRIYKIVDAMDYLMEQAYGAARRVK